MGYTNVKDYDGGKADWEQAGLPMQGAAVDVVRAGDAIRVSVNGREAARGKMGTPIEVRL